MVPSFFGLPPHPPAPPDMITSKSPPTHMYALPSPINMTNMTRQHAVFPPTARSSRKA